MPIANQIIAALRLLLYLDQNIQYRYFSREEVKIVYTKENFYEMNKQELSKVDGGMGGRFINIDDLRPGIIVTPPPRCTIKRPPLKCSNAPIFVALYGIPPMNKRFS
jgi:hypothetical protein